jgi:hypothetical protein
MNLAVSTARLQLEPAAAVRAPLTFITPSETKPVFHSAAHTGGAPREHRGPHSGDDRELSHARRTFLQGGTARYSSG